MLWSIPLVPIDANPDLYTSGTTRSTIPSTVCETVETLALSGDISIRACIRRAPVLTVHSTRIERLRAKKTAFPFFGCRRGFVFGLPSWRISSIRHDSPQWLSYRVRRRIFFVLLFRTSIDTVYIPGPSILSLHRTLVYVCVHVCVIIPRTGIPLLASINLS